jgi:hypothetical protein
MDFENVLGAPKSTVTAFSLMRHGTEDSRLSNTRANSDPTRSTAPADSGIRRQPASVFGVSNTPS